MESRTVAGEAVRPEKGTNVDALLEAFEQERPDPGRAGERVAFGTSGHRGSAVQRSFNRDHILAICQAVAEERIAQAVTGPMYVGRDTHALSEPALAAALEVLTANGIRVVVDAGSAYTPTPVVSRAILRANAEGGGEGRGEGGGDALADGLILTPSHNPPADGGIKYNPPHGGPAEAEATARIEARANELLETGLRGVKRSGAAAGGGQAAGTVPADAGGRVAGAAGPGVVQEDLRGAYVEELASVVDMDAIAAAGVRIGVDPMGGASVEYWPVIAERYGLALEVVNDVVDPTFSFMRPDWDGRIRMDCSSPHAMAGLIELRDRYDIAIGLDPDADRHGIVTPGAGLLNPNHYLAVAVWYLFRNRGWGRSAGVGKTLVSSSMIDRVADELGARLVEVPVGFKWFVDGLHDGSLGFGGEESAGATFLRMDGTAWTTDKDGILLGLLAAEIMAKTGKDPGALYAELEDRFGSPVYERIDAPATAEQKAALKRLSADDIAADTLAGEPIVRVLTHAPGNGAAIGGVKVVTDNGWFAARPSGTEDVYKIYAESFLGREHLERLQAEAQRIVDAALGAQGQK